MLFPQWHDVQIAALLNCQRLFAVGTLVTAAFLYANGFNTCGSPFVTYYSPYVLTAVVNYKFLFLQSRAELLLGFLAVAFYIACTIGKLMMRPYLFDAYSEECAQRDVMRFAGVLAFWCAMNSFSCYVGYLMKKEIKTGLELAEALAQLQFESNEKMLLQSAFDATLQIEVPSGRILESSAAADSLFQRKLGGHSLQILLPGNAQSADGSSELDPFLKRTAARAQDRTVDPAPGTTHGPISKHWSTFQDAAGNEFDCELRYILPHSLDQGRAKTVLGIRLFGEKRKSPEQSEVGFGNEEPEGSADKSEQLDVFDVHQEVGEYSFVVQARTSKQGSKEGSVRSAYSPSRTRKGLRSNQSQRSGSSRTSSRLKYKHILPPLAEPVVSRQDFGDIPQLPITVSRTCFVNKTFLEVRSQCPSEPSECGPPVAWTDERVGVEYGTYPSLIIKDRIPNTNLVDALKMDDDSILSSECRSTDNFSESGSTEAHHTQFILAPDLQGFSSADIELTQFMSAPCSVTGEVLNIGSAGHSTGCCAAPCEWLQRGRACRRSWRCQFCHVIDEHAPYQRRTKAAARRRAKEGKESAAAEGDTETSLAKEP